MPNNFRKSGSFYFSPAGSDAAAGTTPETPKRTPAVIGVGTHVIGAGDYKGAFVLSGRSFIGDGLVQLNLTGTLVANATGSALTDIRIQGNGFSMTANVGITMTRCQLANISVNFTGGGVTNAFSNCVKIAMTETGVVAGSTDTKCIILNSSKSTTGAGANGALGSLTDSYCDEAYVLAGTAYFVTPSTQFRNNNFRGKIVVAGTQYELKRRKDGTAINPNPGIADLISIDATVYARGNFSEDPIFLNLTKSDYFSVSPASPNIMADSTQIGNIGGVFAAIITKATDAAFSSPVLNDGTGYSAGDIVWVSGNGLIISQPVQLTTIPEKPMKRGYLAGLKSFNVLQTKGGPENRNVITPFDYSPGTAGENPQRVDCIGWRMKTTDLETAPVADEDYDNSGRTPPGDWIYSEVLNSNADFAVDSLGRGTADPNFNAIGAGYVARGWIQYRLVALEGLTP